MKKSCLYLIFPIVFTIVLSACGQLSVSEPTNSISNNTTEEAIQNSPEPTPTEATADNTVGEADTKDYVYGLEAPLLTPLLFAPGIVSTENFEHSSPTISPDGSLMFWSRIELPLSQDALHKIVYSEYIDGQWSEPQIAPFSGTNSDDGPVFAGDDRIYFLSRSATEDAEDTLHDIYYVDRVDGEWSAPIKVEGGVNTKESEGSPSLSSDGTLYFGRGYRESQVNEILCAQPVDGAYPSPEVIFSDEAGDHINVNPYINPAGDILLFGSVFRSDGFGACDLYASYKTEDGWSEPVNLGDSINTRANERFPSLSPDGKYLFFVSNRENGLGDVYWVNAAIVYELNPNN